MKNNKLLACPYIVWMILFTIIPLGIVFYYALTDSITGQFTLANLAGMGTYLPIFLRSIWLSLFASLICLVIGYPVASGPLTATFMLPFAMGACEALGGNVMTDAFGLVALVAMMPLITVQVMGAIYVVKSRRAEKEPALPDFGESEIIELWEAC